ncbi:hypothetical protein D3C84_825960 [compost metagenome]
MGEVGHDDHRPNESTALGRDQLQVDREKHVVHAGDHQGGVKQAEDRAADHRRQIKQGDHAFGDENPQMPGHRANDRQRQHAGDHDGGDRHHQQLHRIRHSRPQPFFDDAHHVCRQQDGQDLPLITDLFDLEQTEDVEIRQALAVETCDCLAIVPGIEQIGMNQHQAEHNAEDFAAAKPLGC